MTIVVKVGVELWSVLNSLSMLRLQKNANFSFILVGRPPRCLGGGAPVASKSQPPSTRGGLLVEKNWLTMVEEIGGAEWLSIAAYLLKSDDQITSASSRIGSYLRQYCSLYFLIPGFP